MSGRKASQTNWSVAIVVAIVLVASAFLIVRPVPEEVVGISDDGLTRASGLTRSSETLVIERIDNAETSILEVVSPVYQVSLTGGDSLNDGEFVMTLDESESVSKSVLYTFDRTTFEWIPLPTLFSLSEGTISASLNFSGSLLIVAGARE
ncbi:MAG: hypothetical protein WC654_05850 [Patescibacteria group bacterium]